MKNERNIKEIFCRALHRLGNPPPKALESARERVLLRLRTSGASQEKPLPPPLDTKSVSLWGLRQPFLIFAAVALGLIVCSTLALKTRREPVSPEVAVIREPLQSKELSSSRHEEPLPAPVKVAPVPPSPRKTVPRRLTKIAPETNRDGPLPLPARQIAALPEGEGKAILDGACGSCHRADAVGSQYFSTKAQYEDLISRMVAKGAVVSPAETSILADYLFDHLAGKAIVERSCVACHSLEGIERNVFDNADAYRPLVQKMISYGADIKDDEMAPLVDYLFRTYGKK